MKFTFSLNNVKQERDIPTGWNQVKFKDFLELDGNETKALSIFTGFDENTLKKATITGLDKLLHSLSFLNSEVPIMKFPKKIMGKYDVPYDIGFEGWGQYMDIKEEIDKGKTGIELLKQYPLLCAIYTMTEYNFKEAEKRAEELMNAPCTEVMAVGNFILMKLIALRATTKANYQKEGTILMRWRLGLKAWWTNMAFTVRFYFLKRKLRLTDTNSKR